MKTETKTCKSCGTSGAGNYCQSCGQSLSTKRLSLKSMLHEAFHFFTHLDHGFPLTLKKLLLSPGTMQREYIAGDRTNYQKPFSMFFLCATFAALALYWINIILIHYLNGGNTAEADFFHKYWVVMQVSMLPLYTLLTYIFFLKANFNFAEIAVFQLYKFSFIFILLVLISLLKFIYPDLETRYIEFPAILLYTLITNLNFFTTQSKTTVIILSIIVIALSFSLAGFLQDWLIDKYFSNHG